MINTVFKVMLTRKDETGKLQRFEGFEGKIWPRNHTPPINRPLCGYSGLDGICAQQSKISLNN